MSGSREQAHVAGTHLYYEEAGSGAPLVFIHGLTLDARMWDPQMAPFTERYHVIRYDLRGFGRSALPDGAIYSAQGDLKALLEHVGVDEAVIVGLSMGGGVAIDFALTYPKMTRALILVDSNLGGWEWSDGWNERAGAVWEAGRELGVDAARERWLALPLFAPALEQPDVAGDLGRIVADYSGWHWVNDDPRRYLDPPPIEHLRSIDAPTLVVVGERDEADFLGIATRLERDIPHARKVVLPGVGHMANMEAPEAFNETVLSFLSDIESGGL